MVTAGDLQLLSDAAASVAVIGAAAFMLPAAITGWEYLRDVIGGSGGADVSHGDAGGYDPSFEDMGSADVQTYSAGPQWADTVSEDDEPYDPHSEGHYGQGV